MYKSLVYVSELAILATRDDGTQILIEPESGEIWSLASSGSLGDVSPYEEPPEPTFEEVLDMWRAEAHCEMMQIQDAIIDLGIFDQAETLSQSADPKWRIRWEARAGIRVHRSTPALASYALGLMDAAEIDSDLDSWLDGLVTWTPRKPEPA